MKEYLITKKPDKLCWDTVPAAAIDTLLWSPEVPVKAWAQMCYDAEALYIRLTAVEPSIRAQHTGPLGMPCQDSCLEFFFSPTGDGRYVNIEFNPNRCMFLGIGGSTRIRLLPEEDLLTPAVTYTDNGWFVEYRIPLFFVQQLFPGYAFASGQVLYGNFYKCGDLTVVPHYLAWNPVTSEKPNFHRPADFGTLRFE